MYGIEWQAYTCVDNNQARTKLITVEQTQNQLIVDKVIKRIKLQSQTKSVLRRV